MYRILIISFLANVFAGSPFSQDHIKYSDSDGAKVDWKLFASHSQFKSHKLRQHQRRDEVKSPAQEAPLRAAPVRVSAKSSEPLYKPFSQVPHHLKQLLSQSYQAQSPYVDPNVFFHPLPVHQNAEQLQGHISSERQEPSSRTQGNVAQFQDQQRRGEPDSSDSKLEAPEVPQASTPFTLFDRSVPFEIQQLLHYQAQIPYNVIANHIIYKPEKPFIPEPLPEDEVRPYQYRSRVYYAVKVGDKSDNKVQEKYPDEKRSYE